MNGLIACLVNWQGNISKTQEKTVKTVENHSRKQVEATLFGLKVIYQEWFNGMRRLEGQRKEKELMLRTLNLRIRRCHDEQSLCFFATHFFNVIFS